jgi:hypothetical protein
MHRAGRLPSCCKPSSRSWRRGRYRRTCSRQSMSYSMTCKAIIRACWRAWSRSHIHLHHVHRQKDVVARSSSSSSSSSTMATARRALLAVKSTRADAGRLQSHTSSTRRMQTSRMRSQFLVAHRKTPKQLDQRLGVHRHRVKNSIHQSRRLRWTCLPQRSWHLCRSGGKSARPGTQLQPTHSQQQRRSKRAGPVIRLIFASLLCQSFEAAVLPGARHTHMRYGGGQAHCSSSPAMMQSCSLMETNLQLRCPVPRQRPALRLAHKPKRRHSSCRMLKRVSHLPCTARGPLLVCLSPVQMPCCRHTPAKQAQQAVLRWITTADLLRWQQMLQSVQLQSQPVHQSGRPW